MSLGSFPASMSGEYRDCVCEALQASHSFASCLVCRRTIYPFCYLPNVSTYDAPTVDYMALGSPELSALQAKGTPYRFGYALPDGLPTYAVDAVRGSIYQDAMLLAARHASLSSESRLALSDEVSAIVARLEAHKPRKNGTRRKPPNRYDVNAKRSFPKRYRHKIADNRFINWRIGSPVLADAVLSMLRFCTCEACSDARKLQRLAVGMFGIEYMPLHAPACSCLACCGAKGEHVIATYCRHDKLSANELGDIV